MDVLFQRPDLQVRSARSFGSDVCFVTFDSYSDLGTLDRPGFAEDYLRTRGIDAVHLLSLSNNWYLYPYSAEAFAAARDAVAGYARVITYGSSMGAYAAIRFGRLVGAHLAIAMSPQFSINPETAPYEQRWLFDSQAVDFSIEADLACDFVERAYVFYDPRNDDRRHVECFRTRTELIEVPIPNGGHPVTTLLAEIGLLQTVVLDIMEDRFDRPAFMRHLRANRRRSAQLLFNIANNVRQPARAVPFARQAAAMRPDIFIFPAYLGGLLLRIGRFKEAREALDRALAIAPREPAVLYRISELYEATGNLDMAVAIMDDLMRNFPRSRNNSLRLDFLIDEMVEKAFSRLEMAGGATEIVVAPG